MADTNQSLNTSSRNTLSIHAAPGQALGYYFQLERAMSWVAQSPAGSIIGIETEDDVVVALENGERILEQDKSSVNSYPFAVTKPELWKTLATWLDALNNDEIDISKTTLYLVTNKASEKSVARKLGESTNREDIFFCIDTLKKRAKDCKGETLKYANIVVGYSDDLLYKIIDRVKYKSGEGLIGDKLRVQLASDLQLDMSATEQNDSIIRELLGWIFFAVTKAWREKKPALIDRDSFMREKMTIISRHRQKVLNEALVELGKLPKHEEKKHWRNQYVKQLSLIGCDNEEITNAIYNYLNAVKKKTDLALKGYLTLLQLSEFEKSLERRWDKIFRKIPLQYKNRTLEELGKIVLNETMDYDTTLGEYQLNSHFITTGTYHALSDELKVGWHNNFKVMFAVSKPTDQSKKKKQIQNA